MSRAKQIFDVGASATSAVFDLPDDGSRWYVCPICLLGFQEDSIGADLTEEHVPPKSLGGDVLVLTCRSCNNFAGHTIDASLADRDHIARFARGMGGGADYQGRARMRFGDGEVTVDLTTNPEANRIKVVGDRSSPEELEKVRDAMEQLVAKGSADGFQFQVTPRRRVHLRRARVGDLKTAFLIAFAQFGYRYVTAEALRPIRKQIRDPDAEVIERFSLSFPGHDHGDILLLADSPFPVLLVFLPDRAIMLPFPLQGTPKQSFEELIDLAKNDQSIDLTGSPIPWPKTLLCILDHRVGA